MMLTDFILQWIYSLPIEQQGIANFMICMLCIELLLGILVIYTTNNYVEYVRDIRGY